ncbi:MAG TPA: DUF3203 family protein [Pseudomonas sp.]|nr:DUF3203 family protein [Pseudomonas sp.]
MKKIDSIRLQRSLSQGHRYESSESSESGETDEAGDTGATVQENSTMTVEINELAATCAVMVDGRKRVGALAEARITTDPQARMSQLEFQDAHAHITEEDAQRLLAAGVRDERSNLFVDD